MFSLIGENKDAFAWVIFIAQCVLGAKRAEKKETPVKQPAEEAADEEKEDKKQKSIWTVEQTRWLVEARLVKQPLFDDKCHKNYQLWDRITHEYHKEAQEHCCWTASGMKLPDKTAVKSKFNREHNLFR